MAQGLGAGARQETAEVDVIRAAGGIVVRRDGDEAQILLVHRPRGDWTFPKGKAEPNESDEDTALREVEEETGLACVLGAPAGETQYQDAADRPKVARYWFMGCGDACPVFPGKRYEDWELDDPAGMSVEAVRPIRDEIGRRVRDLLVSLGVDSAP